MKSMVNVDLFKQIIESGNSATNTVLELAEQLRLSGNQAGYEEQIERAYKIYTNYLGSITKLQEMNPADMAKQFNITEQEAQGFTDLFARSFAQVPMQYLESLRKAMGDENFVKAMVKEYGLNPNNYNALINAAQEGGVSEEVIKILTDSLLEALKTQISDVLGIVNQPEFVTAIISLIKQKISESDIKDPAAIQKMVDDSIGVAELSGYSFNPEQKAFVRSFVKLCNEPTDEFNKAMKYINWIYKQLSDTTVLDKEGLLRELNEQYGLTAKIRTKRLF
jgi:hypothetical protein